MEEKVLLFVRMVFRTFDCRNNYEGIDHTSPYFRLLGRISGSRFLVYIGTK
uniref:Ycf2 n=2 Tax=Pinus subgen. Strobus TaxID=139272 RepID=A0A346PZS0_PINPR|nr:ycf2 [Pinus parviflora]ABP35501.1 ORF50l [Pinus koraiensis]AXR86246.1 ycf2 [Pinus parviflora]